MQGGLAVDISPKRQSVSCPADCGRLEVTCQACCSTVESKQQYSNDAQVRGFAKLRQLEFNFEGCLRLVDKDQDAHECAASKKVFAPTEK